jgi:hypothetical protein
MFCLTKGQKTGRTYKKRAVMGGGNALRERHEEQKEGNPVIGHVTGS